MVFKFALAVGCIKNASFDKSTPSIPSPSLSVASVSVTNEAATKATNRIATQPRD
jgi:hypothetical protein